MAVRFTGAGTLDRVRVWNGAVETWYDAEGNAKSDWAHVSLGAQSIGRIDDQTDFELSFHNGLQHFMGSIDFDTGDVETAFIYGPYGELIKESSSADTAMHLRRFNGKEADQLSRLSYYGYRYYDSQSLTWTQADPLFLVAPDRAGAEPRRASLYAFSLNNPLKYLDPDGRDVIIAWGNNVETIDIHGETSIKGHYRAQVAWRLKAELVARGIPEAEIFVVPFAQLDKTRSRIHKLGREVTTLVALAHGLSGAVRVHTPGYEEITHLDKLAERAGLEEGGTLVSFACSNCLRSETAEAFEATGVNLGGLVDFLFPQEGGQVKHGGFDAEKLSKPQNPSDLIMSGGTKGTKGRTVGDIIKDSETQSSCQYHDKGC
tara:strand:+ start:136 stop:1257 length:1122 start_codon:yes stop_codon:yes gene_type:complete